MYLIQPTSFKFSIKHDIEGISVFGFDLLFCDHHGSLDLFKGDKHDDVPRPQPQKRWHKSAEQNRESDLKKYKKPVFIKVPRCPMGQTHPL